MATEKEWRILFDSLKKEDWDRAIQMVDSLVKEEPDDPTHFLKLGDFFQNKRNWEAAIRAYRKAADIYKTERFYEKAILMLKKILSIKPHDFEIQREITELLLEIRPERPSTSYITPPREEQPSEALKESFLRSELLPEPFRKDKVITLLYKADIATFPSQHRIIKEGDTDRTVYIIVRGSVEVKTDIKDQEISLAILQEGDIFGEIAFVTLSPRTASVISLTDTSVLVLEQDILDKIIHQEPLILKYLYDLYKSRR